MGTFVLVLVAGAIGSKAWRRRAGGGLGPYLVGCLVWAIGLSLGGTTGYAINPARDLGPRIAHAFCRFRKRRVGLGLRAVPVVGPLVAALAGLFARLVHF